MTLVNNEYDELGRLQRNRRNGQANLHTSYTYNLRSWTESISCPLFSETLYYNDARPNQTNTHYYNGNISGMDWNVNGDKSVVMIFLMTIFPVCSMRTILRIIFAIITSTLLIVMTSRVI